MARWLNYHHLYYFWRVAKLGSITDACKELRLAQPTVSAQLKGLEDTLGEKLLMRHGRSLRLTEFGQLAFQYAEQIFSLGTEFLDVVDGKHDGHPEMLRVGIADVVPKLVTYRILAPLFSVNPLPRLVCSESSAEVLLTELSVHHLDIVITDCPIPPSIRVKAYNHLLGESGISFLAAPSLANKIKHKFPDSLSDVPMLMPTRASALRAEIDHWFESKKIHPHIIAEFQDSALMKLFGKAGRGIMPVPTIVEEEAMSEFQYKVVGRVPEIKERFYLISLERKLKHPIVQSLFADAHRIFTHKKT